MDRIALGLSGGVDSAVAAALLKCRGLEVHGVYLDVGINGGGDAERLAREMGIDFEIVDITRELETLVKRPFVEGYLNGRTPNPCVICNPEVKLPALISAADRLGCELIATGHYARVRREGGRAQLLRGVGGNDQSYMLNRLTQAQLKRLKLPLGELEKPYVREMARELGLFVADKPDSMEICFVPDNDYAGFIEARGVHPPEGDIVDTKGNVLARHRGIHRYTLGQRRGLGYAAGERVFVSAIDRVNNRIVISAGEGLFPREVAVGDLNWIFTDRPAFPLECSVRFRHSKTGQRAVVADSGEGTVLVMLEEAARAPTPGQSAVFYDGDTVLGGGIIQ